MSHTPRIINRYSEDRRIVRAIALEFLTDDLVMVMQILPSRNEPASVRRKLILYGKWTLFIDKVGNVIYYEKQEA